MVGLIAPVYDAISQIWEGCKVMSNFGRDVLLCYGDLKGQWIRFRVIMHYNILDLEKPLDISQEDDVVVDTIVEQLRNLEQ